MMLNRYNSYKNADGDITAFNNRANVLRSEIAILVAMKIEAVKATDKVLRGKYFTVILPAKIVPSIIDQNTLTRFYLSVVMGSLQLSMGSVFISQVNKFLDNLINIRQTELESIVINIKKLTTVQVVAESAKTQIAVAEQATAKAEQEKAKSEDDAALATAKSTGMEFLIYFGLGALIIVSGIFAYKYFKKNKNVIRT